MAETAALVRYRELGGPEQPGKPPPAVWRRIAWFADYGAIPAGRRGRWQGFRELRNAASHPEFQSMYMPGDGIATLRAVREAIDELFVPGPIPATA